MGMANILAVSPLKASIIALYASGTSVMLTFEITIKKKAITR